MLRAADVLADLVRASRDGRVLDESHATASAAELGSLGVGAGTGRPHRTAGRAG